MHTQAQIYRFEGIASKTAWDLRIWPSCILMTILYFNDHSLFQQPKNWISICSPAYSISLSIHPSVHQSNLRIHPSINSPIHPSIYPPIRPSIHQPGHPSNSPAINPPIPQTSHLFIQPPIHASIHSAIRPSIDQPIHPQNHPSIHPSVHPSTKSSIHASLHRPTCTSIHSMINPSIKLSVQRMIINLLHPYLVTGLHFQKSSTRRCCPTISTQAWGRWTLQIDGGSQQIGSVKARLKALLWSSCWTAEHKRMTDSQQTDNVEKETQLTPADLAWPENAPTQARKQVNKGIGLHIVWLKLTAVFA